MTENDMTVQGPSLTPAVVCAQRCEATNKALTESGSSSDGSSDNEDSSPPAPDARALLERSTNDRLRTPGQHWLMDMDELPPVILSCIFYLTQPK